MGYLKKSPPVAARTLRVLSRLLSYPNAELREHLPELATALRSEAALSTATRVTPAMTRTFMA